MPSPYRVALVGRPNVGKSTLFNRLVGKRRAVVADEPGTTRDRLEGEVEWKGKTFLLTDMAGIEFTVENDTEITLATQAQVKTALASSDLLIWVVDAPAGLTPTDQRTAELLLSTGKPFILAANKCDHGKHDDSVYEFSRYPSRAEITLSSIHGRGINELLDSIITFMGEDAGGAGDDERQLAISIIGRPNVGKSTLLNALSEDVRSVVSSQAGTTRDSVDSVIPAERLFGNVHTQWRTVRVVDTAGIRRRGKIEPTVERWSMMRTLEALEASQVALFMIDGTEGMVHQDLQISERIVEAGRAAILLVNKWDAVLAEKDAVSGTEEDDQLQAHFLDRLRRQAPFLHWIQVIFLSAEKKINLAFLGRTVINAYQAWNLSVDESRLEEFADLARRTPRLKNLQKVVLTHSRPPVFHIHLEGRNLPHFSTIREIENDLRQFLEIGPTLIKVWAVPSLPKRGEAKSR